MLPKIGAGLPVKVNLADSPSFMVDLSRLIVTVGGVSVVTVSVDELPQSAKKVVLSPKAYTLKV